MGSVDPFFFSDAKWWPKLAPYGNFMQVKRLPMSCRAVDHLMFEAAFLEVNFSVMMETSVFSIVPYNMTMADYYVELAGTSFEPPEWRKEMSVTEAEKVIEFMDSSRFSLKNKHKPCELVVLRSEASEEFIKEYDSLHSQPPVQVEEKVEVTVVYADRIETVQVTPDTKLRVIIDHDKPRWVILNDVELDENCEIQDMIGDLKCVNLSVIDKPTFEISYVKWFHAARRLYAHLTGANVKASEVLIQRSGIGVHEDQYASIKRRLHDVNADFEMHEGKLNANGSYDLDIYVDASKYSYFELAFPTDNEVRVNGGHYAELPYRTRCKFPIAKHLRDTGQIVHFSINSVYAKTFYVRMDFKRDDDQFNILGNTCFTSYRLDEHYVNKIGGCTISAAGCHQMMNELDCDMKAEDLPPDISNEVLLGMISALLSAMNFSTSGNIPRRYISRIKHPERFFKTNTLFKIDGNLVHGFKATFTVMMRMNRGSFMLIIENCVGIFSKHNDDDIR